MPLSREELDSLARSIEEAKLAIKSLEEIVADLRVAGIDSLREEEELRALKEDLRKLETFYRLQERRLMG